MSTEQEITEMFDRISPTYDRTNTALSFGLDRLWRKKMIKNLPKKSNASLLDVATGTGEVLLEAFKQDKIQMGMGVDLASQMIKLAKEKFIASPFRPQANFAVANAQSLPFEEESFDAVTMAYGIRNVQDVDIALSEMHRVLRKEGRVLILEFSLPKSTLLKNLHLFYLRNILPNIGQLISKSKSSYVYLNQTIESFPYGSAFVKHLQKAGFTNCKALPILGGITTLYIGDK
ncbi:MAG: Demethylmenaquinone methyltransferase [Chlamydiae bacterium]|nr:Demethylmenaquinone methyltransferase [Chlamydiota bacterium]